MAKTLGELLEAGRECNFVLSAEAKQAHYDMPCSKEAAYVVDQLHVNVLVALTLHAITNGKSGRDEMPSALKRTMEYIGKMEQEVADLRERLALSEIPDPKED